MLTFVIPVKAKVVSGSWERFLRRFERTLKSVTSQTCDDFGVIVVCHDVPEVAFSHSKVVFLQADFPAPDPEGADPLAAKRIDKARKIQLGLHASRERGASYVMVVDADDCVSCRLAEYVKRHGGADVPGWYFEQGYLYKEGGRLLALNTRNFNTLCGSCIIIRPELIEGTFRREPYLEYRHATTVIPDHGSLLAFPYPGAVCSMANGDNIFMSAGTVVKLNSKVKSVRSLVQGIVRKLCKYRISWLGARLKREFNLYPIG